jgi:aminoglycoside phosphotransferase (APT) family kinase protein
MDCRCEGVAGRQIESASWTQVRGGLVDVLQTLHAVSAGPVTASLPPPRAWCGGRQWPDIVCGRLAARLPGLAARAAHAVVADVIVAENAAGRSLVHGDLGLHNLLWHADRVTGMIDFDHACWGDPAIDIAPLIGTFGAA